jgi:hypothetical protein
MRHTQGHNLYINCYVQPKASQDSIAGVFDDQLKIRITAAPTDGKANKHLIKFLAKEFKLAQNRISIVKGQNSRHKKVCIENPDYLPEFMASLPNQAG